MRHGRSKMGDCNEGMRLYLAEWRLQLDLLAPSLPSKYILIPSPWPSSTHPPSWSLEMKTKSSWNLSNDLREVERTMVFLAAWEGAAKQGHLTVIFHIFLFQKCSLLRSSFMQWSINSNAVNAFYFFLCSCTSLVREGKLTIIHYISHNKYKI